MLADARPSCIVAEPSEADGAASGGGDGGGAWSTLAEALELTQLRPRIVLLPPLPLEAPTSGAESDAEGRGATEPPSPPASLASLSVHWDQWLAPSPDTRSPAPPATPAVAASDPDAPAVIIYTSGTTGLPKGAVHTNRTCLAYADHQARGLHMPSGPALRTLCNFPINHVASLVELMYTSFHLAGAVVFQPAYHPLHSLRATHPGRYTLTPVALTLPALLLAQMRMPLWAAETLDTVRHFIFAGAAPPLPMIQAIRAVAHPLATLHTGWGMTETCGFLTFTPLDVDDTGLATTVGAFPAVDGYECRLADPQTGADVAAGSIGEIRVRGPSLFSEYLHAPEKTADAWDQDGWFRTSDMAYCDERGNLVLAGRLSDSAHLASTRFRVGAPPNSRPVQSAASPSADAAPTATVAMRKRPPFQHRPPSRTPTLCVMRARACAPSRVCGPASVQDGRRECLPSRGGERARRSRPCRRGGGGWYCRRGVWRSRSRFLATRRWRQSRE